MKKIVLLLIGFIPLSSSLTTYADTTHVSHFGFPVEIPDGWFVVGPKQMAEYNASENLESLGIPESLDQDTALAILEKLKQGAIEFYFDTKHMNDNVRNNVSVQLSPGIEFNSIAELQELISEECSGIDDYLKEIYGEKPNVLSCQLVPSNGLPVFHHAYTIASENMTIINETVFINKSYALTFVGGSFTGLDGLQRARVLQQKLIDSLTVFLKSKMAN